MAQEGLSSPGGLCMDKSSLQAGNIASFLCIRDTFSFFFFFLERFLIRIIPVQRGEN